MYMIMLMLLNRKQFNSVTILTIYAAIKKNDSVTCAYRGLKNIPGIYLLGAVIEQNKRETRNNERSLYDP